MDTNSHDYVCYSMLHDIQYNFDTKQCVSIQVASAYTMRLETIR